MCVYAERMQSLWKSSFCCLVNLLKDNILQHALHIFSVKKHKYNLLAL